MIGNQIYNLAKELWPLHRSITGLGVRKTLKILKKKNNLLKIKSFPSGKKVFDWIIPAEWEINKAWIKNPKGKKIIDIKNNNLHLVSYSQPVRKKLSLIKLQKFLYSLKKQPNAIPYVTSYYKKKWGFCLKNSQRKKLKKGIYQVYVDSKFLKKGKLNYGEIYIPGKLKKEIFLSTYVCHPSMANNEISGPAVAIFLSKWIKKKKRNFSYRIIFVPETIGSISYIHKNLKKLKRNVFAGFNISCVGDDRVFSFLPSRNGKTISDKAAKNALRYNCKKVIYYTWLDRGSDERQYCAPGIDLPISSIMRSKYETYPEYHTSLDTLGKVVTPKGLEGSFSVIKKSLEIIENNFYPITKTLCEPNLGKRGLYTKVSVKSNNRDLTQRYLDIISLSDGNHSVLDMAELMNKNFWEILITLKLLIKKGIIKKNVFK